jgi:chemotaxis protein methyltransferase CheR
MLLQEFDVLQKFLKKSSGLVITPDKMYLLESRLLPIAKIFNLPDLSALARAVAAGLDKKLLQDVMEAMTTNETSFMRDGKPFERFKKIMLPHLLEEKKLTKQLRIWCAACSSGQETYTLAMLLKEEAAKLAGWNIEIVATDISNDILERARAGVYTQFEVQRGLPIQFLVKYFTQNGDKWHIKPELKQGITFKPGNLLENFGILGKFDLIFCRNVLIYFDTPTKGEILGRMHGALNKPGYVVLGGAETVLGVTDKLKPLPNHSGVCVPFDWDTTAHDIKFASIAI